MVSCRCLSSKNVAKSVCDGDRTLACHGYEVVSWLDLAPPRGHGARTGTADRESSRPFGTTATSGSARPAREPPGSMCRPVHDHHDGPMLDRMMALLVPGYALLTVEDRKRARLIDPLVTVALIIVTIIVFVLSLRSASTVKVTHDQARTYAGILAQVIPVLLLACMSSRRPNGARFRPGETRKVTRTSNCRRPSRGTT